MKAFVDILQSGNIDPRVMLRGRNVGVAEEFLNNSQVGPIGEHVRGKAMSERMWADTVTDSNACRVFLHQFPNVNAG